MLTRFLCLVIGIVIGYASKQLPDDYNAAKIKAIAYDEEISMCKQQFPNEECAVIALPVDKD